MPYMRNLMEEEDWEAGDVLSRIERFEKMREPGRFADYLDVMITATVLRRPIAVLVRARRNGMLGPFVNYQLFWPDRVPRADAPNLPPIWINFHPNSEHYEAIVPYV